MLSKSIFKKVSTYVFLCLIISLLTIFTVAFIKLIKFGFGNYNAEYINIIQMIFSIVGILVLSIYISVIKIFKYKTSQFFDVCCFVVIYLLFSIYPCFDLYSSNIAISLLFGILGFILGIISISIFFYFEKEQNGTVKAKTSFLLLFSIMFETFIILIIELFLFLILKTSSIAVVKNVLDCFVLIGYSWIGVAIFIVLGVISLVGNKKFVNLCLVTRISD